MQNENDADGYSEFTKRCFLGKQLKPGAFEATERSKARVNMENDNPKICWYCAQNTANDDYEFTYEMHKLLKRHGSYAVLGVKVKSEYLKAEIKIPRCKRCASHQNILAIMSAIMFIILIMLFFYYFILPRPNESMDQKIIGIIISIVFGSPLYLVISWLLRKIIYIEMRSESEYPEIVKRVEQGWAHGNKPNLKGDNY